MTVVRSRLFVPQVPITLDEAMRVVREHPDICQMDEAKKKVLLNGWFTLDEIRAMSIAWTVTGMLDKS